MKNKKILLLGIGDNRWLGGLYYTRNIISMILNSNSKNLDVYLLTTSENYNIFAKFENKISIIFADNYKKKFLKKLFYFFILKKNVNREINNIVAKYNINYIYPVNSFPYLGLEDKCIHWIPDFQHKHIPEYFPFIDRFLRNIIFRNIIKKGKRIIVSSSQAKYDLFNFFKTDRSDISILHFVSDIEDYLADSDEDFSLSILDKYNIKKKYCYISNQFWSYKNHMIAIEGIKKYNDNNPDSMYELVCTGSIEDPRNPEYYQNLLSKIDQLGMDNINILGIIPRKEQIQILKNADIVIQPSLFEGWGTSVEEAKRLGLKIILSDIPVHREQKEDNHLLFSKNDSNDLYLKISEMSKIHSEKNNELLEKYFYKKCQKYIKPFLDIIGV